MTTETDRPPTRRADLSAKSRLALAKLEAYCDEWQGKIVEYRWASVYRDDGVGEDVAYVQGHNGPFEDHEGVLHWHLFGPSRIFGWGDVLFWKGGGTTHHLGPDLIIETRLHTGEWCPYGCKDGHVEIGDNGPEYEQICSIHLPEIYAKARDLYHSDAGWTHEGMTEIERLIAMRLRRRIPKTLAGQARLLDL